MSTQNTPLDDGEFASALRLTRIGIVLAVIGILTMAVSMLSAAQDSGPFRTAADYVVTAAALPHGIGLFLALLGIHRLQAGRDGRLGIAGLWVYGVCMAELLVQCVASLFARAELIWGPLYPLCSVGLAIGLALFVAGSWRVGAVPRWMLVLWPLLGLFGSFLGVNPVPFVFVAFLVTLAIIVPARVRDAAAKPRENAGTPLSAIPVDGES